MGVDKPAGMTSHDVVNACRRIFGERRVGHTGTLDPLATGALAVCVGPACRLDRFLVGHDKAYCVRVAFGWETTTDDAQGEPTVRKPVRPQVLDEAFARARARALVGAHEQVPPAYSAIKVNGAPVYRAARAGADVELAPRRVEVLSCRLVGLGGDATAAWWDLEVTVSKGTYVRSLARDLGREIDVPAHVAALRRTRAGALPVEECVSLEALAELKEDAAADPVALLGYRFAFADDQASAVLAGAPVPAGDLDLLELASIEAKDRIPLCMPAFHASPRAPRSGELFALVLENRLRAIYAFDERRGAFVSACGLSIGVRRG